MPLERIPILDSVNYFSIIVRLLLSLICGGAIGLDRERNHQAAGLRTYLVVCVSSALIMITNIYLGLSVGNADLSRMSAGVVSGIGFLGAGAIMITNRNQVRGLTTAAGLWGSAAIGSAFGAGLYVGGLIGFLAIFCCIHYVHMKKTWAVEPIGAESLELYAELQDRKAVTNLLRWVKGQPLEVTVLELRRLGRNNQEVGLSFALRPCQPDGYLDLLERMMDEIDGLILLDRVP